MTTPSKTVSSVNIVVSDPWEFGSEHGVGPFRGEVVGVPSDGRLVIRLTRPITYRGKTAAFFVAAARYENAEVTQVLNGDAVVANFLPLELDEGRDSDSVERAIAEWRGWTLTGTVQPI